MPYDEKMADRTRELISLTHKKVQEKIMFGGLCFMVNDKMCVGVKESRVMVRVDPSMHEEVIEKEGCNPMIHAGKAVKGFVFVDNEALTTKKKLEYWIELALAYNKSVRPSKKKKK